MDTDAIVAAMRSRTDASAALLGAARAGRITLMATTSLCLEYEAVCSRSEHVAAAGFDGRDLAVYLDAVIGMMERIDVWFLWRPQLHDPADELVLEAAVNGRADTIISFNQRDFYPAARRFGIDVLLPREALARLGKSSGRRV
jgi:predicted nucleic acid-binding protein